MGLPEQTLNSASTGTAVFKTTHWTVVLHAAEPHSPGAQQALDHLCRAYWYPLYSYVRRSGYDAEEAKDLTQEFFARLLAKNQLAGVDRTKAKFRSWLLGVMNHFLAHEWKKTQAQKRGGGQTLLSLDAVAAEERYDLEPATPGDPQKLFDRRWAFTVLQQAGARLHQQYQARGKATLYAAIKDFISPAGCDLSYAQAAERLGISIGAVKSAIRRLRLDYEQLVRDEIAQTVTTSAEIDEEIRYLLTIVRE